MRTSNLTICNSVVKSAKFKNIIYPFLFIPGMEDTKKKLYKERKLKKEKKDNCSICSDNFHKSIWISFLKMKELSKQFIIGIGRSPFIFKKKKKIRNLAP